MVERVLTSQVPRCIRTSHSTLHRPLLGSPSLIERIQTLLPDRVVPTPGTTYGGCGKSLRMETNPLASGPDCVTLVVWICSSVASLRCAPPISIAGLGIDS